MTKELCDLCPRHCLLDQGALGYCGARTNKNGEISSLSYGQILALSLDPTEKKPFYKFYPGKKILSAGTFGCNMACPFCQNYQISMGPYAKLRSKYLSPTSLVGEALGLMDYGNIGIAFTYNEPLINFEYVLETCTIAKEEGLKTAIISNGQIEEKYLLKLIPYVDAWNIDLKCFSEEGYRKLGGDFKTTLRTIDLVHFQAHLEVASLIVPEISDDLADFASQIDYLSKLDPHIPIHINRYFPSYLYGEDPTDINLLMKFQDIAKEKLSYVQVRNI